MKQHKSSGGKLRSLPHRELKEIAKAHQIPATGTVDELRERLDRALPGGVKDRLAGSFLQTKQAFSYRYYKLLPGSSTIASVVKAAARRDSDADPFRTELRPSLNEIPQIYKARLASGDTVFLHLAFSGEERVVQDGWNDISIIPPILCVLAIREAEGVLELRGRWEKVSVVEQWIEKSLAIKTEHLKFDWQFLGRLKTILNAKLANQSLRPNSGGIGTIRISSSAANVDLEENESAQKVRKVLSKIGYQPGNQGFVFHPTEIRVRANHKEGSFYIPKHAREEEVTVLRHAFLVAQGLMSETKFTLPAPKPGAQGGGNRTRLLTPDVLQERLERLIGYTASERRTIANVLKGLQRHQQERILPAIWELWLPGRVGSDVMKALVNARVLRRREEASCTSCDYIGAAADFPTVCPECEAEIDAPVIAFALRGFLDPEAAEEQVFHPDYRVLAEKYRALMASRTPTSRVSNAEKKKALEDLAEHLFSSLDGIECTGRNVLTANHEVDRVFRNKNQTHALLSMMGSPLRLECKNTSDKVSSAEFGTFVNILRDSRSSFGVYVSMEGFSGMKGEHKPKKMSDAIQTARDARRDKIRVLMITGAHLEAVCTEGRSLVDVLWRAFDLVESL